MQQLEVIERYYDTVPRVAATVEEVGPFTLFVIFIPHVATELSLGNIHIFLALVTVFAFVGSWVLYRFVDTLWPMRVSTDAESDGLDQSQHGEVAATFHGDPASAPMLEHVA